VSDELKEVMENVGGNRSKRSVTTRNWMMYLFIFLLLLPLRMHTASLGARGAEIPGTVRAAENEQIIIMVQHPASLYALMPRRKESSFIYIMPERERKACTHRRSGAHSREKSRKGGRAASARRSIIIVTCATVQMAISLISINYTFSPNFPQYLSDTCNAWARFLVTFIYLKCQQKVIARTGDSA
jgi:hypothetical protein